MALTEIDMKKKLNDAENLSRDLAAKERSLNQQQAEFDEEHSQVTHENNNLQEQIDKYNILKEAFDRRAYEVREQGEND